MDLAGGGQCIQKDRCETGTRPEIFTKTMGYEYFVRKGIVMTW